MKNFEIQNKFAEYCMALNITENKSLFAADGTYKSAAPGTYFVTATDIRLGQKWQIMRNGEHGSVSVVYGPCKSEQLFGYMEGVISCAISSKEDQMFSAIHSAEGRISTGAEVDQALSWLRDETIQIFKGITIYEPEGVV